MKHLTLYITGMTCINCQTRIQTALQKQNGISIATVSYQTGMAKIEYEPNQISLDQITHLIDELGYTASTKRFSRASVVKKMICELGFIALFYFILQHFGILNRLAPSTLADSSMSYGTLFVIGLITSVHCIAMCGGINLSQVLQKNNEKPISHSMFQNAAAYNLGRVLSYTITGAILGAIGALTGLSGTLQTSSLFQGLLKLLAGALMVLMGINMLNLFPGLRRLHFPTFHFGKVLSKNRNVHPSSYSMRKTPFFIGLLNGLMPCGPLQSMQIVALASSSPITGALSMFFFSLGTVPLMLGFGSIIAGLGKRFTRPVLKFGAILVVVMGLSMMSQGIALSGINSKLKSLFPDSQNTADSLADSNTAIEKDGVQYISSTLESGHYPDITVKAGIPVEWTIHADKGNINGCNYKILLQDFDTECIFEEGDNTITFTPQKEGVYTYSCWMGMITGKIYVEG